MCLDRKPLAASHQAGSKDLRAVGTRIYHKPFSWPGGLIFHSAYRDSTSGGLFAARKCSRKCHTPSALGLTGVFSSAIAESDNRWIVSPRESKGNYVECEVGAEVRMAPTQRSSWQILESESPPSWLGSLEVYPGDSHRTAPLLPSRYCRNADSLLGQEINLRALRSSGSRDASLKHARRQVRIDRLAHSPVELRTLG